MGEKILKRRDQLLRPVYYLGQATGKELPRWNFKIQTRLGAKETWTTFLAPRLGSQLIIRFNAGRGGRFERGSSWNGKLKTEKFHTGPKKERNPGYRWNVWGETYLNPSGKGSLISSDGWFVDTKKGRRGESSATDGQKGYR